MRTIALIAAGAGLAACSTAPETTTRSARGQAEFNMLTAGKVAGATIDCLPSYQASDMRAIDEETAVFRVNPSRLYVTRFNGQCNNLGDPGYALVTKRAGSTNLCRGDIAQMVQTSTGVIVGSCVVGSFTPYTTPGR